MVGQIFSSRTYPFHLGPFELKPSGMNAFEVVDTIFDGRFVR